MEYMVPSSGKLYHHKIRLPKLNKEAKSEEIMREIYEKHSAYLDNKKINPTQMLKLIEKLKGSLNKNTNDEKKLSNEKKEKQENSTSHDVDYYKFYDFENENLNRLDEGDLKKRKNEMDVLYNKNAIKPGEEGYEFDVRKDFDINNYDPEWDDEDESDDSDNKF